MSTIERDTRGLGYRSYDHLFAWFIFAGALGEAAMVLWDFGFLGYIFEADVSGISTIIAATFGVLSLHCLYLLFDLSAELRCVEHATSASQGGHGLQLVGDEVRIGDYRPPDWSIFAGHMRDVALKSRNDPSGDRRILVESLSAILRKRARLGIFMADVLYKLGLLGTVIGFILMLGSMGDLSEFEVETLREALRSMTGGMAVSLLTTISGLVCGTLLRMQYVIVESLTGQILQRTVRLTEVILVPARARAG
jgi:hypothetical protein